MRTEKLPDVQVADVAIVGSGISGALCALELARDGHQVIVLDRRAPVTGSTLASTAIIQFEIDMPLTQMAQRVGWSRAARAWQRSWRAVQSLQRVVAREQVHCGMQPKRSLYVTGSLLGARALHAEQQARARAGLRGTWLDVSSLQQQYGIHRSGAILSRGAASCDPVRLTHGLLRRAQHYGARVYAPVNVQQVHKARGGVWLEVDEDRAVWARHVVFCTGYELLHALPARTHRIISTWAVAGPLHHTPPAWLRHTVLWEAANPYLYLRLDGNTVIAGGRDERHASRYTERSALTQKRRLIADDVQATLPELSWRASHVWGGAFGSSPDALPLIDRVPDNPRCWFVAALGGNGITFSMIAAEIIRDAVRGSTDADASLFRL